MAKANRNKMKPTNATKKLVRALSITVFLKQFLNIRYNDRSALLFVTKLTDNCRRSQRLTKWSGS